uniref:Uncharacterized protein n=1 Tax=Kryptolebias marmoratus TaxID=37003 RepID=A0A3Q3B2U8_KRYMA
MNSGIFEFVFWFGSWFFVFLFSWVCFLVSESCFCLSFILFCYMCLCHCSLLLCLSLVFLPRPSSPVPNCNHSPVLPSPDYPLSLKPGHFLLFLPGSFVLSAVFVLVFPCPAKFCSFEYSSMTCSRWVSSLPLSASKKRAAEVTESPYQELHGVQSDIYSELRHYRK